MSSEKLVYFFGGGVAEGKAGMKELLGGKGANLAEMCSLGLPVPAGFTITTEVCDLYYKLGEKYPEGLAAEVDANLARLEEATGKTFGKGPNPLLVSVRSGAAQSMPGMMDTVLNLGLNNETLQALVDLTGNERFAWDAYRRFLQMFGDVVLGMEHHDFEHALQGVKDAKGVELDTDLDVNGLKDVVAAYLKVYESNDNPFPQDPRQQLQAAIDAVFGSWNNERAIKYRALNEMRGLLGTAVNVQTMVFGNMGDDSATGVAFTRDPSTGANEYFYGEYLINAQGEDVVAGIRTPQQIAKAGSRAWAESNGVSEADRAADFPSLEEAMPAAFATLDSIREKLETHYRDMQDLEFTIEKDKLFMLQTRNGKRTAAAAVKIAVDLAAEGLLTEEEAVCRVDPKQLDQLLHPMFDVAAEKEAGALGRGLPASPGAARGQIVFTAATAEAWKADGKDVILVRIETSPEDIGGMDAANGILTARGGMTSHAAVVARGMGKCCVAGCGEALIDYKAKTLTFEGTVLAEGDWVSLNGSTGVVYEGAIKTVQAALTGPFGTIMDLADKYRTMGVRTNADTPADTKVAVRFGAEGIGLCRTEHMFFEGERITSMRKMILAKNIGERKRALAELLPMQRGDFESIFRTLDGRPATIRLLDPPLHEFLPHEHSGRHEVALQLGISAEEVAAKVNELHEFNPMLGFRGCRLAVVYPEIEKMQVRAIMEAALNVQAEGIEVHPEIMIPLVGGLKELAYCKKFAIEAIEEVFAETGQSIDYKIGTMIEVPRAAITADEVAEEAEFFSFGTNDLTQMTCGFSRDDSGRFLKPYVEDEDKRFFEFDPFQVLDQAGVGKLVKMAADLGRQTRPDIKLGICGEHGGEPSSVAFCHKVGLDYVSCSPYRVPIARLAAAQAAIQSK